MNLIIHIIGLPGTGKSTIAKKISNQTGFPIISTEEVRADIYSEDKVEADKDFSKKELKITYEEVLKIAKENLELNKSIIVEGVYRNRKQRKAIINLAKEYSYGIIGFYITAEEKEILKRLEKRKKKGTRSPAGVEAYFKIKKEFAKPLKSYLTINNS